jgi:hypothetical protein
MKRLRIILLPIIVISYFLVSDLSVSIAYSFEKVYRIPLRVHLGKSERAVKDWIQILEEINHIWFSQAGICFEMETVRHDGIMNNGMDIWFVSRKNEIYNGMFRDEHDIWTKDTPNLRPATDPAKYPAARTGAHELGHGLGLIHNESSDNNLMRSQTFGWKLDEDEIAVARDHAEQMAHPDQSYLRCSSPRINR